jgi:hypothetical protein
MLSFSVFERRGLKVVVFRINAAPVEEDYEAMNARTAGISDPWF